ncbi:Pls/PosA family non-ribosomal peptide synthetase [Streptomyces sp. NPDC086033]|uniref:Pls/PosA family non-ribosomal peptide synthetase n=1 Tax=Streptomyces sp. NPDC086033 TaxID=3365747 RepID=UPI0037D853D8
MVVNPGEITTVAPVDGTAQVFAEVLAGVVKTDHVPLDSHFFDDLGANSLVMAQFCARVRKRDDLPPVSMRDIYGHPTIRGLATALAEIPATEPAPARPAEPPPPPGSTARYVLCGILQFLVFAVYCLAAGIATAEGYSWISGGDGLLSVYLRSLVFGGALFLAVCALPVVAKWVLVGRWKETEFPVWSLAYVRFWTVKALLHANPMILFTGNPLYVLYLRALGARIGPGVTILSHSVPVCTDLLTVGAGTVIRKDALFLGYRAHAGRIGTGPVTLGRDVFVGEKTVLDIGTSIGDGGQLGHSSALYDGAAVPAGQRWHGSPARPTDVDHVRVPATRCGTPRRAGYALVALLQTLLVYVPLGLGGAFLVMDLVPALDPLLEPNAKELASAAFYVEALALSVALFAGFVVLGLVTVTVLPRLLNLTLRADRVYPLYGFHYSVQRAIARMTNIKFFKWLCGDSSYIVPYLRSIGYDLSNVEQTGSNFGTEVSHETPYLATVGSGTMVADGLSILNAEYSSTSFRLSRVAIGPRNFLGNHIAYPVGGRTGDNCLLATKVLVPLDGELREGVGLLGSPPFEIPRTVERDTRFDHFREGDELSRRLSGKNRFNARSIALFLFLRWLHWFLLTLLGFAAVDLHGGQSTRGGLLIGGYLMAGLAVTVGYWALVERVITRFRPLKPRLCSIYDPYFWWHERLWKVPDEHLAVFNGTPFKSLIWRLLGVRTGRRVFDDGCYITERTLVAIGSDTTLGHHSKVQAHSQEDGTFKSDHIVIGDGCTLGAGALVHYGVAMGEGAVLGADAFLMKGEEMPAGAHWGGNPAVALRCGRTG